jgi:hypothetical protein
MSLPGNKSLEEHDPVLFELVEKVSHHPLSPVPRRKIQMRARLTDGYGLSAHGRRRPVSITPWS